MGESVRYDGTHKLNRFIRNELGQYCEFIKICPEMEIGLGVPRAIIRLVQTPSSDDLRAVQLKKEETVDVSSELSNLVSTKDLSSISGYIFKSKSPSCGINSVKIYPKEDAPAASGRGSGLFANEFKNQYPLIPTEEDGRLNDVRLRENFVARLFAHHEWNEMTKGELKAKDLIGFHSRFKYTIMAHSITHYQLLGKIVAGATNVDVRERAEKYFPVFMQAMEILCTKKSHGNTLFHILGYLRDKVEGKIRQEIVTLIDQYRTGMIPLIVPIQFFRHYFENNPDKYILNQNYLHPHPDELKLLNVL